ncbi:helix-turn-helix transcriptional regulator [Embleya sp. NPDC008237]|uniref:helix-turn-helix transcriptional regulator n=1 Tax=Embleya sp. NPDC008237 TaxID=3363978 RepID=UPI0036E9D6BA
MTVLGGVPLFVGREPEMGRLVEALGEADRGEPRIVLTTGEAGVGKTRLLEEFLTQAVGRPEQTSVAVGACLELGAEGLPFAPFSAILRTLADALGDDFEAAVGDRRRELAWISPTLAAEPGHGPAPERARLYESALRLLERIGEDRTLIVAFEDLHWADSATRELLAFLVRSLRRGRILLVGTLRADAMDRSHPMRRLVAELERIRTVTRLELGRLTMPQVEEHLTALLGGTPSRALTQQVYERSEGNAFFVEELAAGVRDGRLAGLSDTLRDLLLIRIEQLPEQARRVVRLAAVGGIGVEHRLLAEVAGLDPDTLETALRAAVSGHVLVAEAEGEGYSFRHALVREAALGDLLPGERTRMYAAFAQALDALIERGELPARRDHVDRRARYWIAAGRPALALPASVTAAAAAADRYAFGEAWALYESAITMWDQVPDPERLTGTTLAQVLDGAIVAARYDNSGDRELALLRQALGLVEEDREPVRAAALWTQRAKTLSRLGRGPGMVELEHAQRLLQDRPESIEYAGVVIRIARAHFLEGGADEAIRIARQVLEIARRLGDQDMIASTLQTLSWFLTGSGELDESQALSHGLEAVRVAEAARGGKPDTLVYVLGNWASVLEGVGRHEESVEAARRALDLSRDRGVIRNTGAFVLGNLAESLFSLGRWDDVAKTVDEIREHDADGCATGHAERVLAMAHLVRGNVSEAAGHLTHAHESARGMYQEAQHRIPQSGAEIALARALGRRAELGEILEAELRAGFGVGNQRFAFPLLIEAARAYAEDEPTASTRAELGRIRAAGAALAVHCELDRTQALTLVAHLDRAEGNDTVAQWQEVVAAWEATTQPYPTAQAHADLGAALVAAGDRGAAGAALARARTAAEQLGTTPLREQVELLARRARIDLPGRPGTGAGRAAHQAGDLTPREREVLRLLIEGRSNRQIAETLFISVKTASVHVSNILAKLEVATRGEAAALAHRMHLVDDEPPVG